MLAKTLLVSLTALVSTQVAPDPDDPDVAVVPAAPLQTQEVEAGGGSLSVRAIPFANVSVDGTLIGTTPFPPIHLPAGPHQIDLFCPGTGGRRTMVVQVRAGETSTLLTSLEAPDPEEDLAAGPASFREACSDGEASACTKLGILYSRGRGVPKDLAQAAALYGSACDGGEAPGCRRLGELYERGEGVARDFAKALELFRDGCQRNDAASCSNLSKAYDIGEGVAEDPAQRDAFARKACELDSRCKRLMH